MTARLLVNGILVLGCLAGMARADTARSILRDLHTLHRGLAGGDESAAKDLSRRMEAIGRRLKALPPADHSGREAVQAAVIHALSGGGPTILSDLARDGAADGLDTPLLRAVAVSAQGVKGDTLAPILKADLSRLPPIVAGHLALVRARLLPPADIDAINTALDFARLHAPGTIVEEAALRRQAMLASKAGDVQRFAAHVARYGRRFGRSVYAGDFQRDIAGEVDRLATSGDVAAARLEDMIAGLPAGMRGDLAARIARVGALRAHPATAALARSAAVATTDGDAQARAAFYETLGRLFDPSFDAAAKLADLSPDALSSEDRALRAAALALTGGRSGWPAPPPDRPDGDAAVPKVASSALEALAASEQTLSILPGYPSR